MAGGIVAASMPFGAVIALVSLFSFGFSGQDDHAEQTMWTVFVSAPFCFLGGGLLLLISEKTNRREK